jgi:hypothetical protein
MCLRPKSCTCQSVAPVLDETGLVTLLDKAADDPEISTELKSGLWTEVENSEVMEEPWDGGIKTEGLDNV